MMALCHACSRLHKPFDKYQDMNFISSRMFFLISIILEFQQCIPKSNIFIKQVEFKELETYSTNFQTNYPKEFAGEEW